MDVLGMWLPGICKMKSSFVAFTVSPSYKSIIYWPAKYIDIYRAILDVY